MKSTAILSVVVVSLLGANFATASLNEVFNINDFSGMESSFTFGTVTFGPDPGFSGVAGGRLRVNDNATDQFSFAFLNQKQLVANGFSTTFSFEFPGPTGSGADGMAFVVHNTNIATLLPFGVDHHGLRNSEPQLSFALDSYDNPDQGENSASKAFVFTDGMSRVKHATIDFQSPPFNIPDLSDSGVHIVQIDYVPGDLDVFFDGNLVAQNLAIDLAGVGAVDANGKAYLGFGAFNGAASENHDVVAWSLSVEVPEPNGWVVMVSLVASMIAMFKTRRRANSLHCRRQVHPNSRP